MREDSIRELAHGLYHNQGDNPGHRAIVLGLKKKNPLEDGNGKEQAAAKATFANETRYHTKRKHVKSMCVACMAAI